MISLWQRFIYTLKPPNKFLISTLCVSTGEDAAVRNAHLQNRRRRKPEECFWNIRSAPLSHRRTVNRNSQWPNQVCESFSLNAVWSHLCVFCCVTSTCFSIYSYLVCAGGQCERIQVACNSQHDLQDWLDLLTKHTHTPNAHTHSHKPQSVCHTVRAQILIRLPP